jgi:hypothetical protein
VAFAIKSVCQSIVQSFMTRYESALSDMEMGEYLTSILTTTIQNGNEREIRKCMWQKRLQYILASHV